MSHRSDSGQAEKLSDLLRPHVGAAIRTWVAGLKATKIWWNGDSKAWQDSGLPDHEVRRRNALHIVEYAIGKPLERSMEVTGNYKELSQILDELRQSPEASRLLAPELFDTLQNAVEGKESPPTHEGNALSDSSQKTG